MQAKNISITFSDYSVPEFKETHSSDKWVNYGTNNLYPDYLLSLYRRSPKHGAIARNKASYILGKGFKYRVDGGDDALLLGLNKSGESLNALGKKVAIDFVIFGGYYLSITWNRAKQIQEVNHVDYTKMRSNKDNTIFYYRPRGWADSSQANKTKEYPAYNPDSPKGTQILYYKDYTPGLDTYTLPEYIQGLNHIEADALVAEHVLNNAKTGFTASKMINFFNGEPGSEEEKKEIEKAIKQKYTGYKGSKIIVSFNDDPAKAPQVLDLGASDLTKEDFEQVDNLISQNIFTVHQVTSPMLFGVRVEGQLGGRSEIDVAYELFKNTWSDEKQSQVEEVVNEILLNKGMQEVMLIPKEPIGLDLFNNSKLFDMLPIEYIYEKMGIKIEDYPELAQVIERKKKEMVEPPQEAMPGQAKPKFSDEDAHLFSQFSQLGVPASDYVIIKKKPNRFQFSDDVVAHERMEFEEINQQEANIIDLIRKDKRITPEALAEALKLPIPYVKRLIEGLEEKGLLKSKDEKVGDDIQIERTVTKEAPKALEEKAPITKEVYIKYSYDGPKDDRNRDFCHRMLELDRLYSRAEIELISQRVGYSVWERRGGFYHNPNTDKTTPFCRHKWAQNIVIKKK